MGATVLKAQDLDMDLDGIIHELLEERNRLDRIIQALEQPGRSGGAQKRPKSRRGRKSMDALAREEVSARMKQYWAKKRQREGEDTDSSPGSA
jgi:hypothetical protein